MQEINKELFENALSISDTKLRECLVPRKEIEAMPLNSSIQELRDKFIETRLSKLVIYEDGIDNIKGYIHQLDLFKNPDSIQQMLLPIIVVPESMNVSGLLDKFSKEGKTKAIEYFEQAIAIDPNGTYMPPQEIFSMSYWGWNEKMSNLLPLDYKPYAEAAELKAVRE